MSNLHCFALLQGLADSSPDSASKKNLDATAMSGRKTESEDAEAAELQREDMVGQLHIARIHGQLRRMKRNSNYSDNVVLTAIPEYRSKVLFTFHKQHDEFGEIDQEKRREDAGKEAEDVAGFIMFECGLEDINLKAATRSGYQGSSPGDEDNLQQIDRILQDIKLRTQFDETASTSSKKRYSKVSSDSAGAAYSTKSETKSETSRNTCHSADDEASDQSQKGSTDDVSDMVEEEEVINQQLQGNASSCVLEFKKVWFNFAAPPPSPKKKKLEFTRLDWNLLSAATPAINAWMNPSHR